MAGPPGIANLLIFERESEIFEMENGPFEKKIVDQIRGVFNFGGSFGGPGLGSGPPLLPKPPTSEKVTPPLNNAICQVAPPGRTKEMTVYSRDGISSAS